MHFETWTEINGQRVAPGVTWSVDRKQVTLQISVRCEGISPAAFVGIVGFDGAELARTSAERTFDAATTAARELVTAAMRRLFAS